jgi:hypothetical protein
MFYNKQKESDRNALSGVEDDLWDEPDSFVAEVKASKKTNNKASESDFENDGAPAERKLTRQSDLRNSKRGILSSSDAPAATTQTQTNKRSNNFVNNDRGQ